MEIINYVLKGADLMAIETIDDRYIDDPSGIIATSSIGALTFFSSYIFLTVVDGQFKSTFWISTFLGLLSCKVSMKAARPGIAFALLLLFLTPV